MEYISLKSFQHYSDCEPLVSGLGYILVDLKIVPAKSTVKISAVIASKDITKDIGVEDCSKVHHALLPRLQALLGTEDTYMEVTSPGMDRNIKNAAEFEIFKGREVRVWDKTVTDWVGGIIKEADSKSVTLENSETKEIQTVSFENIAKAKFIHI
ncbi:ribosome maturation factor RimP [Treponema sp.]|uniref:ribosome maturation factor RimP n=1 Tax=Treponema sp. TaxID=166 RepID=UPI00298D70B6|nr:ribosome maturation factor RimP [Treponema sp.]MCR5613575.1 ribosome maturation factor RimP [Treponema sp.]